MAFEPTRRQVLGGLGALGLTGLANAASGQSATETAAIDYEHLGMFPPQEPTQENPYYYMRFNADTKRDYPEFDPAADLPAFQNDRFILMNFVDPAHRERSIIQMQLTRDLARDLGPIIGPKQFLIADIFVRDADGEGVYLEDYELMHRDNQLGVDNIFEDARIIPYGVAFSSSLRNPEAGIQRLMDFSVSRFSPSEEQLNENIMAIAGNLHGYARQVVNPDQIASLDPIRN